MANSGNANRDESGTEERSIELPARLLFVCGRANGAINGLNKDNHYFLVLKHIYEVLPQTGTFS